MFCGNAMDLTSLSFKYNPPPVSWEDSFWVLNEQESLLNLVVKIVVKIKQNK